MNNSPILSIHHLNKTYSGGFQALKDVNLEIQPGEIFALLGPNGAGKTTLINSICGIVTPTSGTVTVGGFDHIKQYKQSRKMIGLVPQEIPSTAFEKVIDWVNFSRGLFGLAPNPKYIDQLLKDLSLIEKKDNKLLTLSGGMKRRTMIAKALAHEPKILFLDEPTAGVDVTLREAMWKQVQQLRKRGVTIILTTHYIEEAQMMADRVGIINHGEIILIEEKNRLIKRFGNKDVHLITNQPIEKLPEDLNSYNITMKDDRLIYSYATYNQTNDLNDILGVLFSNNIQIKDIETHQSSLEDIFVELTK
jgi:ABC-2 type transport system ATP-binding protein